MYKGIDKPFNAVNEIKNLKDMLSQSEKTYGNKTAFLVKAKGNEDYLPITYSYFQNDVNALGTALLDLGLKGKRIAVIGENKYEWALTYLAVLNGVGTIVPLDKELPMNEIDNLLDTSEAAAIIFAGKFEKELVNRRSNLQNVKYFINMDKNISENGILSLRGLIDKGKGLIAHGDKSYLDAVIDAGAMSILLFTSGTTGHAKGVMLSHKNLCANLMAMCSMVELKSSDVFLSVLPLHHTYESTCGLLCPLYRGATVAFSEGLRHIAKNMKESKATILLAVPLILEAMHKKMWQQAEKNGLASKLRTALKINGITKKVGLDLSRTLFKKIHENLGGKIRLFISGAAAIDPAVARGFRELGIPFIQGYGLSECSPIVALNRDICFKDDAAGLPLPGVEIKINNPGESNVGEIICKGKNVMLGYFENEKATQAVLKDGWFHTGDLGYLDEDGFLHITGRQKNVIVTKNGKNIFPEEVEAYLNRSEFILESLIWGKYDEESGETEVNAQIVPDMEAIEERFGNECSEEQIEQLIEKTVKEVNRQMPLYKRIMDFSIRKEEFAKTTTKKIKRYLEKPEG